MSMDLGGGSRRARRCGLGLIVALVASGPLQAADDNAADEWQEIVARSKAADAERMGVVEAPAATPAPARQRPAAKKPGAHGVTGHTRDARSAGSDAERSALITPSGQTVETGAPTAVTQKAVSAPTVAGPSIQIITGGSSTDGAAKVGRLPITP